MWGTLAMIGLTAAQAYQQQQQQKEAQKQAQQMGQASAWDSVANQQSPQAMMASLAPPIQNAPGTSPWVGVDMGNQQSPWMSMT